VEEIQENIRSSILRRMSRTLCTRMRTLHETIQRNNRLVWDETVSIMDGLFTTVWENKKEIVTDHVGDITLPVCFQSAAHKSMA
jgi:hypothetical protein